jgi:hypothetical protein
LPLFGFGPPMRVSSIMNQSSRTRMYSNRLLKIVK